MYLNLRKSNAPTLISKRKKNRANIYDVIINIKMILISLKDLIHSMIEKRTMIRIFEILHQEETYSILDNMSQNSFI